MDVFQFKFRFFSYKVVGLSEEKHANLFVQVNKEHLIKQLKLSGSSLNYSTLFKGSVNNLALNSTIFPLPKLNRRCFEVSLVQRDGILVEVRRLE